MDCVAKPVTRIANTGTEITYDPPIPFLINSKIGESALKTPKVFSNIKATIVRHPTAAPGDYMGTATISRQQNLVLVTFDFGEASPANQATPAKQIEFGINAEEYESVRYQIFSADNQTLDLKILKN